MSCGNCKICTCKAFEKDDQQFKSFQYMLGKVFDKISYAKYFNGEPDFADDEYFQVIYNIEDGHYEIRPHYEFTDYSLLVGMMVSGDSGVIYDEHGKLVASFTLEIIGRAWTVDYDFVHKMYEVNGNSRLFSPEQEQTNELNIEDYKLKRLILRYISIIENECVTVPVKHEYGSDKLEHLLWMLKNIYTKRNRALLERYMFLGYIQGVLKSKNLIDVRMERTIMRSLV